LYWILGCVFYALFLEHFVLKYRLSCCPLLASSLYTGGFSYQPLGPFLCGMVPSSGNLIQYHGSIHTGPPNSWTLMAILTSLSYVTDISNVTAQRRITYLIPLVTACSILSFSKYHSIQLLRPEHKYCL
jgi:hypothetical protein